MKMTAFLHFLRKNLMWVLIVFSAALLAALRIMLHDSPAQTAQNPALAPAAFSSPTPDFTTTVEQIYLNANLTLTAIYSQATPQSTPALPEADGTAVAFESAPAVSVEEAQPDTGQSAPTASAQAQATALQSAATPGSLPTASATASATGTQTGGQPNSTPTITETLPPLPTATSPACSYQTNDTFSTSLLVMINELRASSGLIALSINDTLQNVALAHSEDMACRDFYDHIGSNGSDFVQRLQSAGFIFARATELLYVGRGDRNSPQSAFEAWLDGPASFYQLNYPAYNQVGIGYVNKDNSSYGGYFTLILAAVQP